MLTPFFNAQFLQTFKTILIRTELKRVIQRILDIISLKYKFWRFFEDRYIRVIYK